MSAAVEELANVRPVRMTVELMEEMVTAAKGRGHRIEWGQPDAAGWWTPTVWLAPVPDPTDPEVHMEENPA